LLIESPRISDADRAVWERLEERDRLLAATPKMQRLEAKAIESIREFASGGDFFVFVSWGKDSVTVADLVLRAGIDALIVNGQFEPFTNPDSHLVRDAFLDMHTNARYLQSRTDCHDPPSCSMLSGNTACECMRRNFKQSIGVGYFEARHVSGVRAEESSCRTMTMRRNGVGKSDSNSCRPIGWWTTEQVFAYLAGRDLPVHPAYAMSFGGSISRRDLRVDDIGSNTGTGHGRAYWENHYYRDERRRLESIGVVFTG
jgi:phosphoadenosine phosphosulfate reductase